MGAKAVINIERNKHKHSDNDEIRHSQSIINNLPHSYHYLVKINGYFAIITEEGENLKNVERNDKIEINCLKKSFGKWVVASSDLDSRLIADCIC